MGFIREFRKDPLQYQVRLERAGKTLHSERVLHQKFLFVSEPDAIQHVLQSNARNYRKDPISMRIALLLRDGLLTSEGEHWRKQRKLMQPAFHANHIASYSVAVKERVRAMAADWRERLAREPGREIDVHREMTAFTLQVAGEAFFGSDFADGSLDRFWDSLDWILKDMDRRMNHSLVHLPLWIPTPANTRMNREIRMLDDVIRGILDAPPPEVSEKMNLLGILRSSAEEERMTKEELRDEILTLCLAGHETTAGLLAWTFYELSRAPQVTDLIREEVLRVTGGGELTLDHLHELHWVRAALMETMRLYPPAWMLSREAIGDDVVGGVKVTKGTIVISNTFAVQRSPRFWENPDAFDPARFMDPAAVKSRHKFSYFPFGGGPRVCIGSSFAMMEATLALANLAASFKFLPPRTGEEVKPATRVTLRPERGIPLLVRLRTHGATDSGF